MSDEITVEWPELTVRRTRVASEFGPGRVRYSLPCANCSLYFRGTNRLPNLQMQGTRFAKSVGVAS